MLFKEIELYEKIQPKLRKRFRVFRMNELTFLG